MKKIIVGQDERVSRFVADCIGTKGNFGSCSTIGVERNGELLGGVVYENYNGQNVCMHVGAITKNWISREFLWFCFYYPFEQLKVKRITGFVDDSNKEAIAFDEHIGFKLETKLKDAGKTGDLLVYVMRKEDCRYLGNRNDIQANS